MASCRAPLATAAAILAGLVIIADLGARASSLAGFEPATHSVLAPIAACLIASSLAATVEAIRLVGGPAPFFCGGREVVRWLLGGPAPEPPSRIIAEGPYSAARHPVYSATITGYLAAAMLEPSILPGLPLVAAWVYAAAILEERILREAPGYREYSPGAAPCAPQGCGMGVPEDNILARGPLQAWW